MKSLTPDEWICRNNCSFYKPNRVEEDRCRGFTLAVEISKTKPLSETNFDSEAFDYAFLKEFLRSTVCEPCPFYVDGCDFTSVEPPANSLPCGGLLVLSKAVQKGLLSLSDLRIVNHDDLGGEAFVRLCSGAALKDQEEHYVYHILNDDLYEVSEDGFEFLKRCDGTQTLRSLAPDHEFLRYCIEEGLIESVKHAQPRKMVHGKSPVPSLRYLEWLVTYRCNLKCSHCYLGEVPSSDFPENLIEVLLEEFSVMQGLRVLVSGGEPTLYRHFDKLNSLLPGFPLRFVLLSNGVLFNDRFARSLNFHEVQISLDGMQAGHEMIRGPGSFKPTLRAMQSIKDAGIDLSVATMIHSGNMNEWDDMMRLLENFGVREWSIDYPCVKGRFSNHPELTAPIKEASKKMEYGFGGSYHGSSAGWTCGRHLAAVLPSGDICRCGLYPEKIIGTVESGLGKAWERLEHIPIEVTDCKGCEASDECGGGCRYRAGGALERDQVMCALYGVDSL